MSEDRRQETELSVACGTALILTPPPHSTGPLVVGWTVVSSSVQSAFSSTKVSFTGVRFVPNHTAA